MLEKMWEAAQIYYDQVSLLEEIAHKDQNHTIPGP